MVLVIDEINIVRVNDQNWRTRIVPEVMIITILQILEVVPFDGLFHCSATLVNSIQKCRDTCLQVNNQVWSWDILIQGFSDSFI